jgi:hypothetical protein
LPEPQLTRELRDLIERHLGSLDEIEVLVCAFRQRGQAQTPAEFAAAAGKPVSGVTEHLEQLVARGFLLRHEQEGKFSYPQRDSAVDEAVEQLVRMYEQRPVTLIKALYDRPSTAVLSFADAFRLRSD